MVLDEGLQLMEQFYDVYSRGLETGVLSTQDWQVVETVRQMDECNEEQQDMLQRLLYYIDRGRIKVG
ncbi:MAG: hypothetical protein F6J87_13090 [Spirulina sp. SIO3F2]|nr:hypothetical protein [Spirulina sp. SIO3F2]